MSLASVPYALLVLVPIHCLALAQAQPITVFGFGYRMPANTITAAPGQILTVSVGGIATRIPSPIFPISMDGFPTEIEGISADVAQGQTTVPLQIRGIQQTACPAGTTCAPVTTLTVQIPFELDPTAADTAPTVTIQENGSPAARMDLNAVTDSVHVINSCDQTGVFLSLASQVPSGTCAAMVMHAHGPLVSSSSPAIPGETLVLWAYGLGAVHRLSPDEIPVADQPFSVGFLYAEEGGSPIKRLAAETPSYVGMAAGVYQMHFVVPRVPATAARCLGDRGNLIVQVAGPASSDVARLCVQP